MQPRPLLIGTYGCNRRHEPARTGGQHENFPQPRVVGRVARGGPRHLGNGCRARRRNRPPCREATRRHRVRPPTVRAHSRAGTLTLARADSSTHARADSSTHARAVGSTHARAVTGAHGLAQSGTVAGAHTETVTQPGADAGVFARTRPRALANPFSQAGTQVTERKPPAR